MRLQQAPRSDTHRVPDSFQLQEAGDLPRALILGGASDDPFHVVGGQPLQLGHVPIRTGDVKRVHIHMRGQHRSELAVVAGEEGSRRSTRTRGQRGRDGGGLEEEEEGRRTRRKKKMVAARLLMGADG